MSHSTLTAAFVAFPTLLSLVVPQVAAAQTVPGEVVPAQDPQQPEAPEAGDAPATPPSQPVDENPEQPSEDSASSAEPSGREEQSVDAKVVEESNDGPAEIAPAPLPQPTEGEGTTVAAADPQLAPSDASDPQSEEVAEAVAGEPEEADTSSAEPEENQEVVVLGSRISRVSGSVQVLREKQLTRFEYDDPTAALQQLPGVYVRQEDGIGLRPNIGMRGVNPDRSKKITLMEDGILFGPAPYSAPAGYFFPLFTRMVALEVVKGPGAIAYGPQTVAGAINYISRPIPTSMSAAADVSFGQFGYNKAHVYAGNSTEQFGVLIEGIRIQNNGFTELPSGADTGSTRNEWVAKASYLVDPTSSIANEFRIKLAYNDEVSNETYVGQTDADFRDDPYRRYASSALDQMKNHRTAIAFNHEVNFTLHQVKLTTTLYRNDYHRVWKKLNRLGGTSVASVLANPESPENQGYYDVLTGAQDTGSQAEMLFIGPNDRTLVSQGVQSLLQAETNTGPLLHKLQGGLRVHNDSIRRLHTEDAYEMLGGDLVYAGQGTITTTDNRDSTIAGAVHLTDKVAWGPVEFSPGARVELISQRSEDFAADTVDKRFLAVVLPGAGLFYEMIPHWGVLAGVHRGFSPPAPGSDSVVSPEFSVNYEAGTRFADGLARAEVIGFFNDYSNLTDVCTLSSGCVDVDLERQFDAGKANVFGIEAMAGHELPLGAALKMPFSVSYTYSRGVFQNSFQSQDPIYGNVTRGDELPYLPPHQVNVTAGLEHKYVGINGAFYFVDRMREIAGQGEYVDAQTTDAQAWLDLSAYVNPLKWLNIYANARNVTGAAYIGGRRPYGARANAPRWIQVGAKASF